MSLRCVRRNRVVLGSARATVLFCALLSPCVIELGDGTARAQDPGLDKAKNAADKSRREPSRPKLGLLVNEAAAFSGYTLLAPTNSTQTYLIDMQGRVVQMWKSDYIPGLV